MSEYSVSEIVYKLKDIIENNVELENINVKGEVTNFNGRYPSGHLYFSIKDEDSSIACVMFSTYANKIDFELNNGDKVLISCSPSLYQKTGKLQLNVFKMKKDGVGDLLKKYEELKNKLTKEGYFNDDHKKEINFIYPNNIAVIVGDNSAAMSDIRKTFLRRWPLCNVDYYPSIVQGDKAPKDLINNLIKADNGNYDSIIIARGGGSFEDLFCFNDEELIKTIFNLKTLIVSGVGHEQDFTLTDFVSDIRASTPTASVELLTPNINDVINDLDLKKDNIKLLIEDKINYLNQSLDNNIIQLNNFKNRIDYLLNKINDLKEHMTNYINNKINNFKQYITNIKNNIKAYSQENTLKRGYSIVYKDDVIINSAIKLKKEDLISIRMYKSKVKAKVKEA